MNTYQEFITTQRGVHERLAALVNHHIHNEFRRPYPTAQLDAIAEIKRFVKKVNKPIILDSGCGTGLSTIRLAQLFPDHAVVGIDRSLARISRAPHTSCPNYLIIRGDLIDLWRLLAKERLPITHHFLFYPNPYPKASQVKRRFHAHPIFRTMIGLSPYFELRTNWRIYAEECVEALRILGEKPLLRLKSDPDHISLFEKKYVESHCPISVVSNTREHHW